MSIKQKLIKYFTDFNNDDIKIGRMWMRKWCQIRHDHFKGHQGYIEL